MPQRGHGSLFPGMHDIPVAKADFGAFKFASGRKAVQPLAIVMPQRGDDFRLVQGRIRLVLAGTAARLGTGGFLGGHPRFPLVSGWYVYGNRVHPG